MNMDDELWNIKLSKRNDTKILLDDIAAVEVQYGCALLPEKKAAAVVRAGKFDYAAVVTVTGTTIKVGSNRGATSEELVAEMHKQFCISGRKNDESDKDDEVK